MGSIRLRGRSLGSCMASGCGAMFVSYAVSALSVSARLTTCLWRRPCSQCRSLAWGRAHFKHQWGTAQLHFLWRWQGSTGSNLWQQRVPFESPGLRRRVVSNRAVLVHASPLILSRLLALPITSYFSCFQSLCRQEEGGWSLGPQWAVCLHC